METTGKQPESFIFTRWLFFRLLGVIHFTAFASYAVQIIGLNGSHGILPTQNLINSATEQVGAARYFFLPTVAWINCSDTFLQSVTWIGSALSLLVVVGIGTGPCLVVLNILWLSIVTGGGEFTGFQSDGMLVEATFLSLFFVPWQWFEPPWSVPLKLRRQSPPTAASLLLLRFMVFRLMFASGLVKILSGDPTWRDLTAMDYHFQTQPIPTPLAWYAHQLPHWVHKCFSLGMYLSELLAPLFTFASPPFRTSAAFLMASLHIGIALTGNYTFLNFLCILLCLPLLNDQITRLCIPASIRKSIEESQIQPAPNRAKKVLLNTSAGIMLLIAASVFGLSVIPGLVPGFLRNATILLSPLHIADSYGLFAVMTTTRPEIVFEGSRDGITWSAYEFKYKPGDDLTQPPPWVEPHMPRLDWRLWFAAMGPADQSPWVLQLVEGMLENTPELQVFFKQNPFEHEAPKYIRAFVYDYHFTDAKTKAATGNWWWRDNKRVYLPAVYLQHGELVPKVSD